MRLIDEMRNRRGCRNGLAGVTVKVDGSDHEEFIRSTSWNRDRKLILTLGDGSQVPAESCELTSKWPVRCCRPSKRNWFNKK